MQVLTTSISVEFSGKQAEEGLVIEADDRGGDSLRIQYLRVFPAYTGRVFSTTGSIVSAGQETSTVDEVLSFTGSDTATLGYPEATSVGIELLGSFYNDSGGIASSSMSFDAATNTIKAAEKGFGLVRVTYKSRYTLYKLLYSGWGCVYDPDYKGPPQPPEEYVPYDDSMVIVYESVSGQYASVTLDGPECTFTSTRPKRDSKPIDIILEVDKDEPTAIQAYLPTGKNEKKDKSEIQADTTIRQYPDIDANIKTTEGTLKLLPGRDGNAGSANTEKRVDMHALTRANGFTMKYPASGNVTYKVESANVIDEWSKKIPNGRVKFREKGYVVQEVRWTGPGSYTGQPRDRTVQEGEVVITDAQGFVISITAVVSASYATTFRRYRYEFKKDDKAEDDEIKFLPAIITALRNMPASDESQKGLLMLRPPATKGSDSFISPEIAAKI